MVKVGQIELGFYRGYLAFKVGDESLPANSKLLAVDDVFSQMNKYKGAKPEKCLVKPPYSYDEKFIRELKPLLFKAGVGLHVIGGIGLLPVSTIAADGIHVVGYVGADSELRELPFNELVFQVKDVARLERISSDLVNWASAGNVSSVYAKRLLRVSVDARASTAAEVTKLLKSSAANMFCFDRKFQGVNIAIT